MRDYRTSGRGGIFRTSARGACERASFSGILCSSFPDLRKSDNRNDVLVDAGVTYNYKLP
ncbi:hypothetical protein SUTMEG_13050 [Sutterella megalosphaeroides]|uniref:Uncharacterized protein n=1 Tax=Sutterella megalosphaeroides TaxID=2494234 RepID=A0A2Z6IAK8_9BURK|nr:hypothetical protein SUTMEG_13050 [Sutterella megalosphaeroides]